MLTLYDAARCPYCARVRILLAEKEILTRRRANAELHTFKTVNIGRRTRLACRLGEKSETHERGTQRKRQEEDRQQERDEQRR